MNAYDPRAYPALARAHHWSRRTLVRMSEQLDGLTRSAPELVTVAAAGSLARLEALAHSDADLIVIVADGIDAERAGCIMRQVWEALAPLGLALPLETGIYARPGTRAQLCEPRTRGALTEDVAVFGQRIQLLLESRPLYGEQAYQELLRAVVQRYASGFLERDPRKEWVYLLNDLIRYFRSYCVWRQWDFSLDNEGWYLCNSKIQHSRLLMYAGLLLLLGECSKQRSDKISWLLARLPLTPLERIALVYQANDDPNFPHLARCYDYFLGSLGAAEVRAALLAAAPTRVEDLDPHSAPYYEELHQNAIELTEELVRFVLARRDDWSARFFHYLLF